MGQVLQAAEQQQILDVYLVIVTHKELWASHYGEAERQESESQVTSWRTLDGGDPGWPPDDMAVYGNDSVLQVKVASTGCWNYFNLAFTSNLLSVLATAFTFCLCLSTILHKVWPA